MPIKDKNTWNEHWISIKNSPFEKILTFIRFNIIAKELSNIIEDYFPQEGFFIDAGSGTSQTAIKIKKKNRKLIALDISHPILEYAKKQNTKIDSFINSDILKLPFKNSSIHGIWNLGVMEHFSLQEINNILNEFSRVLKKNGIFIAFWPATYGPVNILFSSLEFLLRKKHKFFPNEPSLLKSKKWLKNIIKNNNNFELVKFKLGIKNCFIYHIIVLRKK